MNPIQLMYSIVNMTQEEAFNYSRYKTKKSEARMIVEFYKEKLKWYSEIDEGMKELFENEKLKSNIRIFEEYYIN